MISDSTTKTNSALSAIGMKRFGSRRSWLLFFQAVLLVSVPVFFQAPLVRWLPWGSLLATGVWLGLSAWLLYRPQTRVWGDLLSGFSLCWLAGSVYWGWLRWEPLFHLPVEAIGLPLALWGLHRNWYRVGIFFYLGSLLGTAITDLYFYVVDLIPFWRQLMQVDQAEAFVVLRSALAQIQTPWGIAWAGVLVIALLLAGLLPLTLGGVRAAHPHRLHWWGFAGAVLSTLLVDGLFWVGAAAS
uniref:DUF3120 domain-containing protein n=1 Tax=Cyanothece sp. (strain PCC 7425 / ATCC 29141) TaxID=395961 RepID=B8HRK4_CYAP4